jgi:hypothetical protein
MIFDESVFGIQRTIVVIFFYYKYYYVVITNLLLFISASIYVVGKYSMCNIEGILADKANECDISVEVKINI